MQGTVQGTVREPSGNRAPFENGAQLSIACAPALDQKACAQDPRGRARNRARTPSAYQCPAPQPMQSLQSPSSFYTRPPKVADMLLKGQGLKRFAMGVVLWRIVLWRNYPDLVGVPMAEKKMQLSKGAHSQR